MLQVIIKAYTIIYDLFALFMKMYNFVFLSDLYVKLIYSLFIIIVHRISGYPDN